MKGKPQRPPVIQRVAALAMRLGSRHLADYGATRSRHDFTQRQLMACLVLRAYLKTTYRGVLEFLSVSPSLRQELGLQDKMPHYTTLQKFSARSKVLEIADAMIQTIGQAAGEPVFAKGAAAMDATGLETTTASAHFQCRRGGQRRKWVKISTIVLCGSLLPLGLVMDWGPNNDKCQAKALISKASQTTLPAKLYADAGYDAEWIHAGQLPLREVMDRLPGFGSDSRIDSRNLGPTGQTVSQPVTDSKKVKTENIIANKGESHDMTLAVATCHSEQQSGVEGVRIPISPPY
jgi:hypothetical protein